MDAFCKFYIVRHGETEFNKTKMIMGYTGDSPLTETGIAQAGAVASALKDIHFDAVFSSDLLRTQRTAKIILAEKELAIQTTKALRERNYGVYEGRSLEEYRSAMKEIWEKLDNYSEEARRSYPLPDGIENDEALTNRVIPFLREVAVAHIGKTVLIVTHGGVLRTLLIRIGFATAEQLRPVAIFNGAYVAIDSDGIDFFVRDSAGLTAHNE